MNNAEHGAGVICRLLCLSAVAAIARQAESLPSKYWGKRILAYAVIALPQLGFSRLLQLPSMLRYFALELQAPVRGDEQAALSCVPCSGSVDMNRAQSSFSKPNLQG